MWLSGCRLAAFQFPAIAEIIKVAHVVFVRATIVGDSTAVTNVGKDAVACATVIDSSNVDELTVRTKSICNNIFNTK